MVLSPHLDDAAFSASREVAAGALVVSVFCGDPGPGVHGAWDRICGFGSSSEAVAARCAEDDVALGLLGGAPGVRLALLDDQYLAAPRPADEVGAALRAVLDRGGTAGGPELILAPAGIGGHPDHLAVRDAAIALCRERGLTLRLYADLPYAVQFGWPSWVDGGPARGWDASVAWELLLPADARPIPDVAPLTDDEVAAKLRALRAYPSQWGPIDALGQLDDPALWRFEPRWAMD
jgi:LmbE family N-acetylglucosaminyl deacetylase